MKVNFHNIFTDNLVHIIYSPDAHIYKYVIFIDNIKWWSTRGCQLSILLLSKTLIEFNKINKIMKVNGQTISDVLKFHSMIFQRSISGGDE